MREETLGAGGSSAEKLVLAELLVANNDQVRPLSVEAKTRALSRISSMSEFAFSVSRK